MSSYDIINGQSLAIEELNIEQQETIQGGNPLAVGAGVAIATEYIFGISIIGIGTALIGAKLLS